MSRILITGGAGFIGSHLVGACLDAGYQVHITIRPGSCEERLERFEGRVFCHRFDLRSELELRHCVADVMPRVIFHVAASPRRPLYPRLADARDSLREELDCLISLMAAAAEVRRPPDRLVRTGSLAEYGAAQPPYREEAREAPLTVYGAGLVAATHYVGALQPRLPFPVATGRLALVYGPTQSTNYLLPSLITRCLAGDRSLVRRPSDRRDLILVDDAVAALLRMATAPLPGAAIINVSSGIAPTMREVAELVLEHTCADPALIEYGDGSLPTGAADLRGSPERAERLLGWRARTALSDGIARTVRWYREHAFPAAIAAVNLLEDKAAGVA